METTAIAQMIGSLVAVIVVILLMAWMAKRMPFAANLKQSQQWLQIKASLPIGAREKLMIVQAGSEYLVLGVSPGQIRRLHVLAEAPADFSAVLAEQGGEE